MCLAEDSLSYLYQNYPRGKSSFLNFKKVLISLQNPHHVFPSVHVAGSNGKGSVCLKIQKALSLSGFKAGLYTSPHLFKFNERIIIGNQQISDDDVHQGLQLLFRITKQLGVKPTIFEMTTLLAFWYFAKEKVDIAVIETGIGGRLDATRCTQSILTIITSISLEHTDLLGDTHEKIGREKAGICKRSIPLVLGPTANLFSIHKAASKLGCPVFLCQSTSDDFEKQNTLIAKLSLDVLSSYLKGLNPAAILLALSSRPMCRLERKGGFVFDVAHNPDAFIRLFASLKQRYPDKSFKAIVGMSSDKDYPQCLRILSENCKSISLVKADTDKAVLLGEMVSVLKDNCYESFQVFESVREAVYSQTMNENELCIVLGTFYIMKEAMDAVDAIQKERVLL